MSRLVGSTLPKEVLVRLKGEVVPPWSEQAILVATVDAKGRPHFALVSYFELAALDASRLFLAIGQGSRTAGNLTGRGKATLGLVDPCGVYYLKTAATPHADLPGFPQLAVFCLTVEELLLDAVGPEEESAYLTSGITFSTSPVSLRQRQELRQALLAFTR